MNKYPEAIKKILTSLIEEMAASPTLFVKNPGKDFTRKRKLPFETIMQLIISMEEIVFIKNFCRHRAMI
ncbi:hypothetical protein [Lacrimispora indolis]|uniref:hypothetical protein n=1 Tax=Lacrimispora indolis TaxID=69825 RepID=UPI000688B813|nr:hypothetical protein [[Clostridium] methoxybenzovorans]